MEILQEALKKMCLTSCSETKKKKAKAKAKAKEKGQKKQLPKVCLQRVLLWNMQWVQKRKKDAQTKKSSWKRRMTSSAYHSARLVAKKQGKSPNTCKIIARTAHQKMSNDIDAGLVKNPEGD